MNIASVVFIVVGIIATLVVGGYVESTRFIQKIKQRSWINVAKNSNLSKANGNPVMRGKSAKSNFLYNQITNIICSL